MAKSEIVNHEMFLQLFVRHERAMRAYARTLLSSWQDVDEAIQEASIVAWRKFGEFDSGSSFGAWLAVIIRFEALKIRRGRQRDRLVFSEELLKTLENEGAEDLERLELQRVALEKCLGQLHEAQRRTLGLAYGSGLKLKEVAERNGYTIEGFYKVLQRLRTALLKCAQRQMTSELDR